MATRIRRVTREAATPAPKNKTMLEKALRSIAAHRAQAEQLISQAKVLEEELFANMKKAKLDSLEVAEATAAIVRSAGKAQNIVDPKALRLKLKKDADYFACISVSITKAKQFLGEKELSGITTNIPGVAGEPALKITLKKGE